MKASELIRKLQQFDVDEEIVVFVEGKHFPALEVVRWENNIEIGCGWAEIEYD